jgi:hypothetical protein
MANRKAFFGLGVFFMLSFCLMIFVMFMAGSTEFNYNSLILLSMAALAFSQYYVFPHIEANDERAKEIKSKALSYSSTIMLLTLSVFLLVVTMNPSLFTAFELLQVIIMLFIVTQSSLLVFVSKRI